MLKKQFAHMSIILGASSYAFAAIVLELSKGEGFFLLHHMVSIYLFSFIFLFILYISTKKKISDISNKEKILCMIFGLFNISITYCFYSTLKYYSVPVATLLLMQSSWITTAISCLINKKKPSVLDVISMIMVMLGLFIASYNSNEVFHFSWKGILWGFATALSYSLLLICSGNIAKNKNAFEKSMLSAFGALIFSIFLFNSEGITSLLNPVYLWTGGYAIFATVIPLTLLTIGMANTSPSLAGVLITLEIPAAYLFSYIFLEEVINIYQILGCLMITSAIMTPKFLNTKFTRST